MGVRSCLIKGLEVARENVGRRLLLGEPEGCRPRRRGEERLDGAALGVLLLTSNRILLALRFLQNQMRAMSNRG